MNPNRQSLPPITSIPQILRLPFVSDISPNLTQVTLSTPGLPPIPVAPRLQPSDDDESDYPTVGNVIEAADEEIGGGENYLQEDVGTAEETTQEVDGGRDC